MPPDTTVPESFLPTADAGGFPELKNHIRLLPSLPMSPIILESYSLRPSKEAQSLPISLASSFSLPPLAHPAPASPPSSMFLKHSQLLSTSGPLHVLCPRPGMPFLLISVCLTPTLSALSSNVTSPNASPPCSPSHLPFPVQFPSQYLLSCDLSLFIYLPFMLFVHPPTPSPGPMTWLDLNISLWNE